mmetsp:Transcript_30066/g.46010  ORF Transcript_30066/g.46010 Transcript_30066/m.46010 type:complete len:99 (+) Transcript_30066:495-791(+)
MENHERQERRDHVFAPTEGITKGRIGQQIGHDPNISNGLDGFADNRPSGDPPHGPIALPVLPFSKNRRGQEPNVRERHDCRTEGKEFPDVQKVAKDDV